MKLAKTRKEKQAKKNNKKKRKTIMKEKNKKISVKIESKTVFIGAT